MGYDVTYFTVHMARGALKLRLFFDHGLDSAEKYSSKIQTLTLTAHKKPGPRAMRYLHLLIRTNLHFRR